MKLRQWSFADLAPAVNRISIRHGRSMGCAPLFLCKKGGLAYLIAWLENGPKKKSAGREWVASTFTCLCLTYSFRLYLEPDISTEKWLNLLTPDVYLFIATAA